MGNINNAKTINYPSRSVELAEFVGIILGDGGLTRYQLTITLHHIDEIEYIKFVAGLIKKLFDIQPGLYHREKFSVVNIVISRRELVIFCNEYLGIKTGSKIRQQIDIPQWIKENEDFAIACMRGLFDTDGSVIFHRYSVNGKRYCYKKLEFCTMSPPLLKSSHTILSNLDLNPRLSRGKSIWLDSKTSVKRYFETINSNNSKHLKRYRK